MAAARQQTPIERLSRLAKEAGVPRDQLERFLSAGYVPQPKQLLFHAACRECDAPDGPIEVGFGGARGPGKSHASFAQVALDDCQRVPGSKWLFLRKVGKAARESFEDLRIKVLRWQSHEYKRQAGVIEFPNGSRIFFGHFQHEKDIDNYLGIEYDGVVIEEATQLSSSKYQQIKTCVRTSKQNWRPRLYLTTNPGGVGHVWFKQRFIEAFRKAAETVTRFIPANYRDNFFLNKEYVHVLNSLVGWLKAAWKDGDWDIAAGQYFSNFRYDAHVIEPFEIPAHWDVWAGMDYGFTHPTAVYFIAENDGDRFVVAEHCEAKKLPPWHSMTLKEMAKRIGREIGQIAPFVAGADVFAQGKDKEARTIAQQYEEHEIMLSPVSIDRVSGWSEILTLLGDVDADTPIKPRLKIFNTCVKLIECLPALQHDPHRPEDVLKWDIDDDGIGGDDPADALRYGLMARPSPAIGVVKW
jgi:phage terminase large subunit